MLRRWRQRRGFPADRIGVPSDFRDAPFMVVDGCGYVVWAGDNEEEAARWS